MRAAKVAFNEHLITRCQTSWPEILVRMPQTCKAVQQTVPMPSDFALQDKRQRHNMDFRASLESSGAHGSLQRLQDLCVSLS